MCRAVTCRKCGKTTWAGCGQHVDSVMRAVPAADRCQGHEGEPSTGLLSKCSGADFPSVQAWPTPPGALRDDLA